MHALVVQRFPPWAGLGGKQPPAPMSRQSRPTQRPLLRSANQPGTGCFPARRPPGAHFPAQAACERVRLALHPVARHRRQPRRYSGPDLCDHRAVSGHRRIPARLCSVTDAWRSDPATARRHRQHALSPQERVPCRLSAPLQRHLDDEGGETGRADADRRPGIRPSARSPLPEYPGARISRGVVARHARRGQSPRPRLRYSVRRARRAAPMVPSSRKSSAPPIGTPWASAVTVTSQPSSASAM